MAGIPGSRAPITSLAQLDAYSVIKEGQFEVVRQTLYDFQTYAQAGQTQLSFFQNPIGQAGKTKADTNLQLPGQLPAPQKFVIQSVEIVFFPSVNPSETAAAPAANTGSVFTNDTYAVMKSGFVVLTVGQKDYITEAPIGRFPPKACRLDGWSSQSDSTTAGAAQMNRLAYAVMAGRPYPISPWIKIDTSVNFVLTINWPAAVALAAADNAARIGVIFDGLLVRAAQ